MRSTILNRLSSRAAAIAAVAGAVFATAIAAHAAVVLEEHVTNGALDLEWVAGFGISNTMQPLTLAPADAGYDNLSGDHTVGLAQTSATPDSGGIILTCVDPGGIADYTWEAYVFTGEGNSRRGLVVRAEPSNDFASNYQFVLETGMLQLRFRKLIDSAPVTLGSWFTTDTPGGFPAQNTWHHMKVIAAGDTFRCFWDGFELTSEATPIVDADFSGGWVGVYNFRFDIGFIPFLVDDLILTMESPNATQASSWGRLKGLYR